MKKLLFTSALFLFTILSFAQVPQGFNYQAVLRNSSGELISNQSVDVEISIRDIQSDGTILYTETHTKTTNAYGLVNLVVGTGTGTDDFSAINWAINDKFIQVKVDATDMGTFQLLSVPFAMHAGSATNLGSENVYTGTDTLFVVKDANGNPVFVVFPDGVKVIVEDVSKGSIGGFAVSGRSPTKAESDIFRVTPDSTRIYVNDSISTKGSIGGFAVSGRSPTKGLSGEYLVVTIDSTRIYVNDTSLSKGSIGGFAVSGRSPTKAGSKKFMDMTKENYFIGHESGIGNTTGEFNSFVGYQSGKSNTTGEKNVFMGYQSGYSNDTASFNVFIGNESGKLNTFGNYNSFIGYQSGYNNIGGTGDIGSYNVFLGYQAGYSNTTGYSNVANGYRAFYSNTEGYYDVASGYQALFSNTSGASNVASGHEAMYSNTTGSSNVAIGLNALRANIGGSVNIAIGPYAINNNSDGDRNVAIGSQAMFLATGSENTALGWNSFSSGSGFSNSTALGAGTAITASNQIRLGNASVTSIGGYADWTNISDERFKSNIKETVAGLNFILKLRPVTYNLDLDKIAKFNNTPDSVRSFKSESEKGMIIQTGFIAQEVEQAAIECGYSFSGVDAPKNENDHYGLRYSEFVVPLVKAVQEQQQIIENQQQIIEDQNSKISGLEERLSEIEKLLLAK